METDLVNSLQLHDIVVGLCLDEDAFWNCRREELRGKRRSLAQLLAWNWTGRY